MREKVEEVLNKIRPILAADGGDVEVVDIGGDGDPGDMDEKSVKKLRKELEFSTDEVYLNF